MRLSFNIRLRLLAFFLTFGGVLILTSCSDDDIGYDVGINEVKEVTVRLNISAGEVGDISVTRGDEYDENVLEGEYMNSLCVFVVEDESNTIIARFEPTSDDNEWEGKIYEWTSDEALTLTVGSSYTVYAFSNWETVTDPTDESGWMSIINKSEEGTLEASELNINIEDPASKVNIEEGRYIPMSGSATINVTEESTTIDVGMDRLVGRVEITIDGETGSDAQDVTVTSLSFSNYADKVQLMKGNSISTSYTYDKEYSNTSIELSIEANSTETPLAVFYVNETSNANGFDISLTTTRKGVESSYTATTQTKEIPRNYILPIYLTLSTYTLDLTVNAYAGPIGAAERQYSNIVIENEDTYKVTLADVTTWFTMTPNLIDSEEQNVSGVTWDWEQTSEKGQLYTEESESGDYMLTASELTATTGYEYSFNLTATWTSTSGVKNERTFHINIELDNYHPDYKQKSPAHSSWQGWYWNKEQLNMYRIH